MTSLCLASPYVDYWAGYPKEGLGKGGPRDQEVPQHLPDGGVACQQVAQEVVARGQNTNLIVRITIHMIGFIFLYFRRIRYHYLHCCYFWPRA